MGEWLQTPLSHGLGGTTAPHSEPGHRCPAALPTPLLHALLSGFALLIRASRSPLDPSLMEWPSQSPAGRGDPPPMQDPRKQPTQTQTWNQ